VVAGLLGTVAATLLLGTTISWYFAVDASSQADKARANEADAKRSEVVAKQNEADAVAARNDLARTAENLKRSRDELETTLARSLLRPLSVRVQPGEVLLPPLSDPEIEALWELASLTDERLGVRFVQEALRGSLQTRQLKERAVYALQAAVGLNDDRRTQVEGVLGQGLQAPSSTAEQRLDIAKTLAQVGPRSPGLAGRAANTLSQALSKTTNGLALSYLAQVAARMEPKEAGEAAATLTQAMAETTDPGALQQLAQGLSAVAARMEPKEAATVCGQAAASLTQAMAKTTQPYALQSLASPRRPGWRRDPPAVADLLAQVPLDKGQDRVAEGATGRPLVMTPLRLRNQSCGSG
jgi:hypothetical protein